MQKTAIFPGQAILLGKVCDKLTPKVRLKAMGEIPRIYTFTRRILTKEPTWYSSSHTLMI